MAPRNKKRKHNDVNEGDASEIDKLRQLINNKIDKVNNKIDKVKNEIVALKNDVSGIHKVFEPGTLFALLETSITKILEANLDNKSELTAKEVEMIIFNASAFGSAVITKILTDPATETLPAPKFAIKKYLRDKLNGLKLLSEIGKWVVIGIHGFVRGIKPVHSINGWPPGCNPLMHNGMFLKCLFSPAAPDCALKYTPESVAMIKDLMQAYRVRQEVKHARRTMQEHLTQLLIQFRRHDGLKLHVPRSFHDDIINVFR